MTWKMIPFDKLFIDRTGGNKKLKQSEFLDAGILPIVDQGQKFIAGYTNDKEARCNVALPCITFGDHTRAFKLIDFQFALGADGVKVLQPTNEVDARYAYFYLNQVKLAGKEGYQRNFKYLKQVSIPLPPLPIQKQIAAILEKADAAREKRRQANKLTEQFLQSAFLEMFGDPVTNPKGWKTGLGRELFKFASGKSNSIKNLDPKYPYPTYGGNGITGFSKEYLIEYDTIVIGRVGVYCGSIHRTKGKVWITDNAIYVRQFKSDISLHFAYYLFSNLRFNKFASYSGQPKITQAPLEEMQFILPPLELQQKFAALVEKVESLQAKQRDSEKELENLFGSLMQRAFRGSW